MALKSSVASLGSTTRKESSEPSKPGRGSEVGGREELGEWPTGGSWLQRQRLSQGPASQDWGGGGTQLPDKTVPGGNSGKAHPWVCLEKVEAIGRTTK